LPVRFTGPLLRRTGRAAGNISSETTSTQAWNRNCGKKTIEASESTPTITPRMPAQRGQVPRIDASDAAMISTDIPAAPAAWISQPASSTAWLRMCAGR